jgi:hypothetical protein
MSEALRRPIRRNPRMGHAAGRTARCFTRRTTVWARAPDAQHDDVFQAHGVDETGPTALELCRKIGDGRNQAADLISATASIPSLNFIPLTTFGNWF